jgi:hypothetical protein
MRQLRMLSVEQLVARMEADLAAMRAKADNSGLP